MFGQYSKQEEEQLRAIIEIYSQIFPKNPLDKFSTTENTVLFIFSGKIPNNPPTPNNFKKESFSLGKSKFSHKASLMIERITLFQKECYNRSLFSISLNSPIHLVLEEIKTWFSTGLSGADVNEDLLKTVGERINYINRLKAPHIFPGNLFDRTEWLERRTMQGLLHQLEEDLYGVHNEIKIEVEAKTIAKFAEEIKYKLQIIIDELVRFIFLVVETKAPRDPITLSYLQEKPELVFRESPLRKILDLQVTSAFLASNEKDIPSLINILQKENPFLDTSGNVFPQEVELLAPYLVKKIPGLTQERVKPFSENYIFIASLLQQWIRFGFFIDSVKKIADTYGNFFFYNQTQDITIRILTHFNQLADDIKTHSNSLLTFVNPLLEKYYQKAESSERRDNLEEAKTSTGHLQQELNAIQKQINDLSSKIIHGPSSLELGLSENYLSIINMFAKLVGINDSISLPTRSEEGSMPISHQLIHSELLYASNSHVANNNDFTFREHVQSIKKNNPKGFCNLVVLGESGAGKTQLVRQYAVEKISFISEPGQKIGNRTIYWFNAEDSTILEAEFRSFSLKLGIDTANNAHIYELIKKVAKKLVELHSPEHSEPFLLIFDNVESSEQIEPYVKSVADAVNLSTNKQLRGEILITSTQRGSFKSGTWPYGEIFDIAKVQDEFAKQLFVKTLSLDNRSQLSNIDAIDDKVKRLFDYLDYHPMSIIEMAGSINKQQWSTADLTRFFTQEFDFSTVDSDFVPAQRARHLHLRRLLDLDNGTIIFFAATMTQKNQLLLHILNFCAIISPYKIQRRHIKAFCERLKKYRIWIAPTEGQLEKIVESCLKELENQSFIKKIGFGEQAYYTIHRSMQKTLRDILQNNQQAWKTLSDILQSNQQAWKTLSENDDYKTLPDSTLMAQTPFVFYLSLGLSVFEQPYDSRTIDGLVGHLEILPHIEAMMKNCTIIQEIPESLRLK